MRGEQGSMLRALCDRLIGTAAERGDDPHRITNKVLAYYGQSEGFARVLKILDQHLRQPQIVEAVGSTHSEDFIPGVGKVQVSYWPDGYFAAGERSYLALSFAIED